MCSPCFALGTLSVDPTVGGPVVVKYRALAHAVTSLPTYDVTQIFSTTDTAGARVDLFFPRAGLSAGDFGIGYCKPGTRSAPTR